MLKWTLTLLMTLTVTAAAQQPADHVSKEDVYQTLDSLEQKFAWLSYRISLEQWDQYTTGHADSLDFYQGLYLYVISQPGLLRTLKQGEVFVSDDLDLRRLHLIENDVRLGRVEASRAVAKLRDSLSQLAITYRPEFDGSIANSNDLYRISRTDGDRARREEAYRAYNSVGLKLADGLTELFRLRNEQAVKLGYENYFAMVFSAEGFDLSRYLLLLNRLDSLSSQPYRAVLNQAQERLNYDRLETWDLAYAYADINRSIDRHFPADSQMAYATAGLKALGFDLDKMPIYFDLKSRPGKTEMAYAFPIKPPYDVRVLANVTDGFRSMQVLMHEIGHALYAANILEDRRLFVDDVASAWSEGQAQIIAGLMDNEDWLQDYAHVPPAAARDWLQARQDQNVIYLRLTLTRLMFEYEAYSNPNRDLNKLYWDLFEGYMMLPRHEELKPWASIIQYTTHPVYLQNYLYADMITAQTYNFLTGLYGEIVANPAAKAFLVQNYYRFGSRYPWRDLLERGTGKPLDPKFFIEKLGL